MQELWEQISPFDEGHLAVSDIHNVHYALYGNPEGVPVIFLHGGPGGGCCDDDARWFDPDRFFVVTHDQRGCGKSIPWAEIRDNTPQELVGDIEKLRAHLRIERPFLIFAGSWGTTLALLYAQACPENVAGMVLRGVFTCGWKDQDYFYSEDGAARFSPKAWERFVAELPPGSDRIQERLHRLFEEGGSEEKKRWFAVLFAYEYSFFEDSEGGPAKDPATFEAHYAEMRINCHYQANRFFLEDGQILRNTKRIEHVRATIVHGLRDVICPPMMAWTLHRRLPKSRLILVREGGHLSTDPGIKRALLEEVNGWSL
jgi:proline iminopeptidase